MGAIQGLELALQVPDSCNIIVSTSEETVSRMRPLQRRNEVAVIRPIWHLAFVIGEIEVPHLQLWQWRRRIDLIMVPNVDEVVSATTCGQDLLVWVPFGEANDT